MSSIEEFFKGIKNKDGSELTDNQKLTFCDKLRIALLDSKELEKIHYNTQVYNLIENGVTTRGGHSVGVATVSKVLAEKQAELQNLSKSEKYCSAILAECFGYMHDLGHTPFGHDGEGALGDEMERFAATEDYKETRKQLFGDKYAENTISDKMCYEHNETSAVISEAFLIKFAEDNKIEINNASMSYIKTAILAHSTSRVKEEPNGIEQKAVRLADKVAYIPQDLADLLKQGVINIIDLKPEELELIALNDVQNENDATLSDKERNELSQCASDEARKEYISDINKARTKMRDKLKNLNKLPKQEIKDVTNQLDVQISQMQQRIAEHCFVKDKDNNIILKGFKEEFDKAVKLAEGIVREEKQEDGSIKTVYYEADKDNANEIAYTENKETGNIEPKNKAIEGSKETGVIFGAAKLIKSLNIALVDYDKASQNKGDNISYQESLDALNKATDDLKKYLVDEMKMEPTMATLWITKHKYQDSFISGRVHVHGERYSPVADGTRFGKTLGQVNNRNENSWKMKVTFQYFLSNMNMLPADFKEQYSKENYNDQQIVSAYIASFTNGGLDLLYKKLKDERAVISREEAAQNIANNIRDGSGKSKFDSTEVLNTIIPKIKKDLKEQGIKVSENDILEYLSERTSGYTIVNGKVTQADQNKIAIPYSAGQQSIDSIFEKEYGSFGHEPKLLHSTIVYTTSNVSFETIMAIQEEARKVKEQKLDHSLESQKEGQKGE